MLNKPTAGRKSTPTEMLRLRIEKNRIKEAIDLIKGFSEAMYIQIDPQRGCWPPIMVLKAVADGLITSQNAIKLLSSFKNIKTLANTRINDPQIFLIYRNKNLLECMIYIVCDILGTNKQTSSLDEVYKIMDYFYNLGVELVTVPILGDGTLLERACQWGDARLVEWLLGKEGFMADGSDFNPNTMITIPLVAAFYNQDQNHRKTIFTLLLQRGAQIHQPLLSINLDMIAGNWKVTPLCGFITMKQLPFIIVAIRDLLAVCDQMNIQWRPNPVGLILDHKNDILYHLVKNVRPTDLEQQKAKDNLIIELLQYYPDPTVVYLDAFFYVGSLVLLCSKEVQEQYVPTINPNYKDPRLSPSISIFGRFVNDVILYNQSNFIAVIEQAVSNSAITFDLTEKIFSAGKAGTAEIVWIDIFYYVATTDNLKIWTYLIQLLERTKRELPNLETILEISLLHDSYTVADWILNRVPALVSVIHPKEKMTLFNYYLSKRDLGEIATTCDAIDLTSLRPTLNGDGRERNDSLLTLAVAAGNSSNVKFLLKRNIDPTISYHAVDEVYINPLYQALMGSNIEIFNSLWHWVVENGRVDTALQPVLKGDLVGHTLISYAIGRNRLEELKSILHYLKNKNIQELKQRIFNQFDWSKNLIEYAVAEKVGQEGQKDSSNPVLYMKLFMELGLLTEENFPDQSLAKHRLILVAGRGSSVSRKQNAYLFIFLNLKWYFNNLYIDYNPKILLDYLLSNLETENSLKVFEQMMELFYGHQITTSQFVSKKEILLAHFVAIDNRFWGLEKLFIQQGKMDPFECAKDSALCAEIPAIFLAITLKNKSFCQAVAKTKVDALHQYLEKLRAESANSASFEDEIAELFGEQFTKRVKTPATPKLPVKKAKDPGFFQKPATESVFSSPIHEELKNFESSQADEKHYSAEVLKFQILRDAERNIQSQEDQDKKKQINFIRNIIRHHGTFLTDKDLIAVAEAYLEIIAASSYPMNHSGIISTIKNNYESLRSDAEALFSGMKISLQKLSAFIRKINLSGFGALDSSSIYAVQMLCANIGAICSDLFKLNIKESAWVDDACLTQLHLIRSFGNAISHQPDVDTSINLPGEEVFDYAVNIFSLKKALITPPLVNLIKACDAQLAFLNSQRFRLEL